MPGRADTPEAPPRATRTRLAAPVLTRIRQGVDDLRLQGWSDEDILAKIASQPTSAEYAELKAATTGERPAKAMVNVIQGVLDE